MKEEETMRLLTMIKYTVALIFSCIMLSSFAVTSKDSVSLAALKQAFGKAATNLDPKVLDVGLKAYNCANNVKGIVNKEYLTIIDYTKPSSEKRLWVFDMKQNKLVSEQLVAHGQKTGGKNAKYFSNTRGSHQSSIGVYVTGGSYNGKNGLSLRLKGLDSGYNDKANQRAIVMHGANYVSQDFIKKYGMLGRSWGCPALEPKHTKSTINKIKNGSLVVAYYKNNNWIQKSSYLNCVA